MITLKELNPQGHNLTPEQAENLTKLHAAINVVRREYGQPMIITSGVRSWEEHERIYKRFGRKPPVGSAHLKGAACDVWDQDKRLWGWCLDHLSLLEKLNLYLEDGTITRNWVHFQVVPPKSGRRIFLP